MGVSVGSLNFKDTILNGEEGDIEGTTTEIEDEDVSFLGVLFVETVGNSGSGGLVNDSLNVESSNDTGILSGLSLGIVEISWDGNDSLFNWLCKKFFSKFFHLINNH